MNQEFKKLFSGLLQEAGTKTDEGKTLLKDALNKITQSPSSSSISGKTVRLKTQKQSQQPIGTAKQPSAFQQNLLKLKQYDDVLVDDEGDPIKEPAVALSETAPAPIASPVKPATVAKRQTRNPTTKTHPVSPQAQSLSPKSRTLDDLEESPLEAMLSQTKNELNDKLVEWQSALKEAGYTPEGLPTTEKQIEMDEALVERLQTILDQISIQIVQVQAKKNELETQKLLFDSTCTTLYEEREAYRQAIESLALQISQKHDETVKYTAQWEKDDEQWRTRKEEITAIRTQVLDDQQHYQQSIAGYLEQLDTRKKTLAELEAKLNEQISKWETLSQDLSASKETAEAEQVAYRDQITDYVKQLQIKQEELEKYMVQWDTRITQWTAQLTALEDKETQWTRHFTQTEQLVKEAQDLLISTKETVDTELKSQQHALRSLCDEKINELNQKKNDVTAIVEESVSLIDTLNQEISTKQTTWAQTLSGQLAIQQQRFDEEHARLNTLATQQIDLLTEKLAAANELYLTLYREHQRQLAETVANQPDIVTESIWRNRLSYAIAFLPQLPVYVSTDDISMLFGGIPVQFKSPYVPPSDATTQIKWQLFERLPPVEKETLTALCKDIANHYRIEFHPVAQNVAQ